MVSFKDLFMSSPKKVELPENSQSDEESDCESIVEDTEVGTEELNLLDLIENDKKIEYNDGRREIYFVTLSKLFKLLDNEGINFSKFNRVIDMKRVDTSFTNFSTEQSDPIILANIKGQNCFDILDGQHRLTYLDKNRGKFMGDEKIILDIRYLDTEEQYKKLLDIINNRMNFSQLQLNKYLLFGIKEGLIKRLRNEENGGKIYGNNRPRINWENMATALVNTKTYRNSESKVEDIINKLVMLNGRISRDKSIYEKYLKTTSKTLQRAFDLHIFLGIDRKYRIIKMIDDM